MMAISKAMMILMVIVIVQELSFPWVLPEHRRLPLRRLWIFEKRQQAWAFRAEQGGVWHLGANFKGLESGRFDEGGEDVDKLNQFAWPGDDQFWWERFEAGWSILIIIQGLASRRVRRARMLDLIPVSVAPGRLRIRGAWMATWSKLFPWIQISPKT